MPYAPGEIRLREKYQSPGAEHWLGTDRLGRDVLSGLIHGTRYALTIGLVAVGISLAIGLVLGALAGYFGGWIDLALSRLFELWAAIPSFFLILTVAAFFPPSLFFVVIIIGLTSWVGIARLTRSQFLQVRSYDYVAAARSLGYSNGRIMFRHILPNAIGPILIPAAFGGRGGHPRRVWIELFGRGDTGRSDHLGVPCWLGRAAMRRLGGWWSCRAWPFLRP